jgi:DNA-binding winged helix-turn-helix (wHTH) protein
VAHQADRQTAVMRGLYYTGDGTLGFQPPLDEAEDAEKFCPHCHGSLNKTRAPTLLPPPWFDHEMRQVIVGNERRRIDPTLFRLLVIFWERPDKLLSKAILMSLLYPNPDTAPCDRSMTVVLHRLRLALLGTPYSILNRWGEGFIFTAKPPGKQEISRLGRSLASFSGKREDRVQGQPTRPI